MATDQVEVVRLAQQHAVTRWLLSAARATQQARQEWREYGVALLACGDAFSAVRISASLVHAAAGSAHPGKVDSYLGRILDGGPVCVDVYSQYYYALARPDAQWPSFPGTELLGQDHYLGVPAPDRTEPARCRAYWCTPPIVPGHLCEVSAVADLVHAGFSRQEAAVSGTLVSDSASPPQSE